MSAAVRVVLPWSTWPMVPMLTCGLVRSYLPRAARTVRVLRRWDTAAEEGELLWINRLVVDFEINEEEERSNLGEGEIEGDCEVVAV